MSARDEDSSDSAWQPAEEPHVDESGQTANANAHIGGVLTQKPKTYN
jgi:hypothetical protein